jgi:hypothetical protein
MDIWKQELEHSWAGWLRAELPDVCWRTEKHRRLMLAEKAAAAIEIEAATATPAPAARCCLGSRSALRRARGPAPGPRAVSAHGLAGSSCR